MPKGLPNTQRWDCRFDHFVVAALQQGFGTELVLSGIETYERAHDIRKGIYRCARHRKVSADAGPARLVTAQGEEVERAAGDGVMGIRKTGKTYELHFKIHNKRAARKRHLERYGPDRAAWPYDPRRPATPEERESWAARNERGEPVTYT